MENNSNSLPSNPPPSNPPPSSSFTLTRANEAQGAIVIQPKAAKPTSKKTTRAGAPNYSSEDITELLDITGVEEPLGANHWAVVASIFASWAIANSRPQRDQDSLKNKFDKMANMKKKTGDPSCPEPVRRAKNIARAIHNKCAAMTLGESSGDKEHEGTPPVISVAGSEATDQQSESVGENRKKRKTAATGTPSKAKTEQLLLEHIGNMTARVGAISESIKTSSSTSLSKSDVVSIVKEELSETMKATNDLLLKMNSKLENLSSGRGT